MKIIIIIALGILIIIESVMGVIILTTFMAGGKETKLGIATRDENSIWYALYEDEIKEIYEKGGQPVYLKDKMVEEITQKAEKNYKILKIIFVIIIAIMFGLLKML